DFAGQLQAFSAPTTVLQDAFVGWFTRDVAHQLVGNDVIAVFQGDLVAFGFRADGRNRQMALERPPATLVHDSSRGTYLLVVEVGDVLLQKVVETPFSLKQREQQEGAARTQIETF